MDDIDKAVKQITENIDEIKNTIQKSRQLNLDYAASEDDFKSIIAEFLNEQKKVQQKITDLHFALREKINAAEWEIIFAATGDMSSE